MQVQELVTIVPWTFIATICNLFIQMYLIKRFLFKPITKILEERKRLANAELEKANQANQEAQALKEEYEHDLANARERANEIVTSAQKTAQAQSEALIQDANRQVVAIKAKAESDIAQEKRKAINEIKDEIGGMAVEIAGQVIGRELNEDDHAKLINDFIANVGEGS